MKLIVNKDRSTIAVGTWGTKNENDYEILEFEFPEELENYNKRIVYYLGNKRVWDTIVDNKAYLTNTITTKDKVKAYVWLTKENTEREADTDFRTKLFEMKFYDNDNADGIVPTEEQIDGFNTMLTAMNRKIDEVNALEQTILQAETERQENENTRISNESTRESNESTRQTNEQTRQEQEADRERRTDEAIADIKDKTAEYNQNAEAKTTEFNTNATQKTNEFNSNYTQKVNDFNTNATTQKTDFNSNASSKTSAFNSNAETKTNAFNTNATNKTNAFNSNAAEKTTAFDNNATEKTSEFNSNAESKTLAFNDNATQKTTNFDNNASEKTDEFNTNAQEKIDEYDEHIVEYQAQIDELQEEVDELSENMPWSTTEQATEISVDDAAKYSRNKLELFGNTSQDSTSIDGGDEYDSPSPDHPQPIHVVTGENTIEQYSKNLLYFPYSEYNWGGTSYINGSKIVIEGSTAIVSSIRLASKYNINIAQNTTVTFSARIVDGKGFYEKNWAVVGFKIYYDDGSEEEHSVSFHSPAYKDKILSLTITTSKKVVAIAPVWGSSSIGRSGNFIVFGIQMEIGTNATEYMDGKTAQNYSLNLGSMELCKIGDYQDYLFKENGNWYKYGVIGKVVLNGTQAISLQSINAYDIANFLVTFANNYRDITKYVEMLCDKFAKQTTGISATKTEGFLPALNSQANILGVYIRVKSSTADTTNAMNTWLSANNTVVYYVLDTPASTQITDETLIAQLDAIYEHLKLVKGTNNITVTAEDLAPYMKLTYMQDLPSKLDNIDSRLALLE